MDGRDQKPNVSIWLHLIQILDSASTNLDHCRIRKNGFFYILRPILLSFDTFWIFNIHFDIFLWFCGHSNWFVALLIIFQNIFPLHIFFFYLAYACFGKEKTYVSEEILNWHGLSLSAEFCIHFYCLTQMRQASQRKIIQSSALRLRLWLSQFKISLGTPVWRQLESAHYEGKINIRFTTFSFQYLELSKFTLMLQRRPHEWRNAPNDRYTYEHKT